ncbi:MAG: hypothetical protein GX153_08470, partial [Clostridiaceae bacterium]|nr:hypothetical protein [Clostridiaceae bacterium]
MKNDTRNKLVSAVQKALFDFRMVRPEDRLLVGISGGKDSMALLHALHRLSAYHPVRFTLAAATVRMGFERGNTDLVAAFCAERGIPFSELASGLGTRLFLSGREAESGIQSVDTPCSLCA